MDTHQLFKKYFTRVALHGLLKSLIFAVLIGLMVNFLMAFVLWFTDLGVTAVLIIELGAFAVTTLAAIPILYFKCFKPTTAKIAWLIDRLGLEERIVTMCEMEKDPSYVAMLQREDAQAKLKNVSHKDVKFNISRLVIIALAITFLFGTSMTTVSALAASGNVKHGGEVFNPPADDDDDEDEKKEYVIVTYIAGEGGIIQGSTLQKIEKGADAEPVTAVPLDGYRFVVWEDGLMTAQRWDWSVQEDFTVEAQFEPIPEDEKNSGSEGSEGDEGEKGEGEGDESEEGDDKEDGDDGEEGDKEGDDGEGQDGDGNGDEGDGEGDAPGEGDGPKGEGGPEGDGNTDDTSGSGGNSEGDKDGGGPDRGDEHPDNAHGSGPGASPGKNTDNNNVVDGKTDYHDIVDTQKNKEELAGDETLPPELKDILDGYFDSLKP